MSRGSSNAPEEVLKKLRRLDANMRCPNCDTKASPGIGFGNICVKYRTFVCDLCKTSHQAISHRVKSVSMSTWTIDEVRELMDENGGGNDAARYVWLANAPAAGHRYNGGIRPKEGDRIENFKQFVLDCYEYGKFKSNTPYVSNHEPLPPAHIPVREASARPPNTSTKSNSNTPSTSTKSQPNVIDLLDVRDDPFQSSNGNSKSIFALDSLAVSSNFPAQNQPTQNIQSSDPFGWNTGSLNGGTTTSESVSPAFSVDPFSSSNSSSVIDAFLAPATPTPATNMARSSSFNGLETATVVSQQAVFDPFGNDVLIPASPLTSQSQPPVTTRSVSDSSVDFLSMSLQQSTPISSQVPQMRSNPPAMGSSAYPLPMGGGLASGNSGLAISSMGALLPQPGIPQQRSAPMGGYSSGSAYRGSSFPSQSSPAYSIGSGMGYSNQSSSSKGPAIGAFDFVDAELKASIKR